MKNQNNIFSFFGWKPFSRKREEVRYTFAEKDRIRFWGEKTKTKKRRKNQMKKSKKKVLIAILCVAINIILLSQLLFGSVSALYDSVTSLVSGEEVVCCAGHGLEPGVEELEPEMTRGCGPCTCYWVVNENPCTPMGLICSRGFPGCGGNTTHPTLTFYPCNNH